MSTARLGDEVAVGLLAGPEEFQRIRETMHTGMMGQLWRRFEASVKGALSDNTSVHPLGDVALAAAILRRDDWAASAIDGALAIAHKPVGEWIHPEAGCMTLTGMHHAQQLCLVVDWLWPLLNRDQREALLGALIAKSVENLRPTPDGLRDESDGRGQLLFARRLDKADPHCLHRFPGQANNWDMWFASGLYMAACLAERAWLKPDPSWPKLEWGNYYDAGYELDAARVKRWKAIATERIQAVLATQLGPDGDYAEGLSYAGYGGRALILALTSLARTGGGNLFNPSALAFPRWARTQFVADLPFGAANFNDSLIRATMPAEVLAHLARQAGDPELQGYVLEAIEHSDGKVGHLGIVGFDPALASRPVVLPNATCFRFSGTVIWRTAQGRDGVFFALKSGTYGGAHQHRDRNTIFLSAYGEHLIVDTGDSRYVKPPAPEFADTVAHNCVLVDGRGQVGDNERPVNGAIVEHVDEGGWSTALADAAACYEGLSACRRRAVFVRPDLLVLSDRVEGPCERLTWLLQGYNADGAASWTCEGNGAVLHRPQARLHVFFAQPPESFRVVAATQDGAHKGVLRLASVFKGREVTAVLVPSRQGEPEPTAERNRDGALVIRFRGQAHGVSAANGVLAVGERRFSV